jgi:hypothetical protein
MLQLNTLLDISSKHWCMYIVSLLMYMLYLRSSASPSPNCSANSSEPLMTVTEHVTPPSGCARCAACSCTCSSITVDRESDCVTIQQIASSTRTAYLMKGDLTPTKLLTAIRSYHCRTCMMLCLLLESTFLHFTAAVQYVMSLFYSNTALSGTLQSVITAKSYIE